MSQVTFGGASQLQRVQMIEEALEKVLDRGPEMSVESFRSGEPMHVWVLTRPGRDQRTGYDLNQMAREIEALLP